MTVIALTKLHNDPENANACPPETLEKIKRNIGRTGNCPPLIVRPHPKKKNQYVIIDGHHRKRILEDLGWGEAECQVWPVDATEARIALATLNRLHGEDNLRKRAELIETLTREFSVEELSRFIPEEAAEIQDMLRLLELNEEELEKAIRKQTEEEVASLPVPLSFMVSSSEADLINAVLEKYRGKDKDRGRALVGLCRKHQELIGDKA